MITIAAVATIGIAEAACSYIEEPVKAPAEKAWAYQWKFSGKTTKADTTKCGGNEVIVRVPSSLKIEGWSFYCTPECGDFETMQCDEIFWMTKPTKVMLDGGIEFEVANIIGKKAKEFETAGVGSFTSGVDTYALTFAGIGKYDLKKQHPTSVKGNFAGVRSAPRMIISGGSCVADDVVMSAVWPCGDCTCVCPTETPDSVVYGKWSMKFNSSRAKKYAAGTLPAKKVFPNWAR